jgi:hypothetical protein
MRIRNHGRRKTSRIKRPVLVLASLFALLGILPFVLPFQFYIPRIEQAVSNGLQEPVSISKLKLALFPSPHITLEGVTVGILRDINIQYVTIYPDVFSLTNSVMTLNAIELDGIKVDDDMIDKASALVRDIKGTAGVRIREIRLRHLDFKPGRADFGLLQADIELNPAGGLDHGSVSSQDGGLNAVFRPDGRNVAATLTARNWRIPADPHVVFETLNIDALISNDGMKISDLNGTLYGGSFKGEAVLDWSDGWMVNGNLKANDIELGSLLPLFTTSASVSGRLNMDGNYRMSARDPGKLGDNLDGLFRFNIKNGVIYNMDLARAVRSVTHEVRGGQTSFEQFTGKLRINGKQLRFQDTRIASGLLKAEGNLNIGATRRIAGHARVEIKGTASVLSMPMEISGNLSDPVLLPEKTAMAGAVAGTAMLGPGIGTSAGAKAGEFVNKLFK